MISSLSLMKVLGSETSHNFLCEVTPLLKYCSLKHGYSSLHCLYSIFRKSILTHQIHILLWMEFTNMLTHSKSCIKQIEKCIWKDLNCHQTLLLRPKSRKYVKFCVIKCLLHSIKLMMVINYL